MGWQKNTNCSYTPGSTNIALENGAGLSRCILIENDENGHIPAIAMLVYQRVMNLDTDEKDNEMKLMKFYSNIRAKYNNLSRRLTSPQHVVENKREFPRTKCPNDSGLGIFGGNFAQK